MTLERAIERRLRDQDGNLPRPNLADLRLERDIERAKMQFLYAKNVSDRTAWLRTMEALISMRSTEQVRKMERERGLV